MTSRRKFMYIGINRVTAVRALQKAACVLSLAMLAAPAARVTRADDVKADAPDGSVVLRFTKGGAYFVAEPLKKEYDQLLARVQALQADLDAERVSGGDVLKELKDLRARLDKLRAEIDQKKVLVSPLKAHLLTEETSFDLGPEKLLVITADHVRLLAGEGQKVRCVLEKVVLSADNAPADDELAALKVAHARGPAPDVVGRTQAERDADEQKFLASEDGRKMTPAGRKGREDLLHQIAAHYAPYAAFQGKPIDTVEIRGLTGEQGNRHVGWRIASHGGDITSAGEWRRHAMLTVHVPPCQAVAVRGCLGGLDIRGVRAPLLLTSDGSQDRDYEGSFAIKDLGGPLTALNVPLDSIDGVKGDVTLRCTTEMVNTGTTHDAREGDRTLYTPPPRALTCRNIEGDLTAWFTRSDLKVENVTGRLDVRNEFGNTAVALSGPLADRPHRVLSEAGRVDVRLSGKAIGPLPILAMTNCGTVRTNGPQDVLEETNFSTAIGTTGETRGWRGVMTARTNDDPFGPAARLAKVLEGADRPSGLDLVSRGGVVRFTYE